MGIGKSLLNYGRKKVPEAAKYPGFNRRMVAATIDSLLLLFFLPVINSLAPINTDVLNHYTVQPADPYAGRHLMMSVLGNQAFVQSWLLNFFMQMLFWSIYSAICMHFWSATPGKILLRMKVVDSETGGRINDRQVLLRSFGYLVSTVPFCIGFFWINFNERKRGWHDYLAGTVVINLPLLPWEKELAPDAPSPEPTETEESPEPEKPIEIEAL